MRTAEFEGIISIRGDVDVSGTIEVIFLRLLSYQKNSTLAAPLRPSSSQIVTIVKELQFNVSIDIKLEKGESSRSAWIGLLQSVRTANPPKLEEI